MTEERQEGALGRLLEVIQLRKLGSKSALAESIGVTAGAIYSAERRGEVTPLMANAIQGVHGISAEWILTGKGSVAAVSSLNLDLQLNLEMLPRSPKFHRMVSKELANRFMDNAFQYSKHAWTTVYGKLLVVMCLRKIRFRMSPLTMNFMQKNQNFIQSTES